MRELIKHGFFAISLVTEVGTTKEEDNRGGQRIRLRQVPRAGWATAEGIKRKRNHLMYIGHLRQTVGSIDCRSKGESMEHQLQAIQRIQLVGTLASGLAHDFNNSLVVIMGISDILKRRYSNDSEIVSYVNQIMNCVEQASKLSRRLLSYSRQQTMEPVSLHLNKVVIDLREILRNYLGEEIEIKTILCQDLPNVFADSVQMGQVLMNLCINAKDAMPEGGELLLETDLVAMDEEGMNKYPYMKVGRYVLLSVSDTGTGMDENTIKHAFDPFFTTKETGRGVGLGLSMVYGIIKQHNGFIHLSSELGKGTTFRVHLPVFDNSNLLLPHLSGEKRDTRRDDPKEDVT